MKRRVTGINYSQPLAHILKQQRSSPIDSSSLLQTASKAKVANPEWITVHQQAPCFDTRNPQNKKSATSFSPKLLLFIENTPKLKSPPNSPKLYSFFPGTELRFL
ncbi:hypothetical protein M758_12G007500 [Ceratodon purpureus]|uniref:Uncharacterized protein n=1 Tax=Ceratodon purpureus TaxID=3225 RepID=A0A8T0G5L6_CERPU|nr:hypothetical protein KC19_12G006800 [Ceratodon purpureus]KAG0597594.1 hypothetical protein M758_12G007500 [Ceratodon purpureus]